MTSDRESLYILKTHFLLLETKPKGKVQGVKEKQVSEFPNVFKGSTGGGILLDQAKVICTILRDTDQKN